MNKLDSLQQNASVTRIDEHSIWFVTETESSCNSCQANGSCGTSLIAQFFPQRFDQAMCLPIPDDQKFRVGDKIIVEVDESYLHKASLYLYAVPIFGLLFGSIAGAVFSKLGFLLLTGELLSIIMGLFGLMVGFSFLKYKSLNQQKDFERHTTILNTKQSVVKVDFDFPTEFH